MPEIIIKAPKSGISQSALVGFADVRNLDIHSIPGVCTINNILTKRTGATVTDQINWIVRHPITTAEVYALGNTGKVYKSLNSGATWALMTGFTSGGHGNGLAIFKNYLIVARDAFLDVCGDGTATGIVNANWTNGWKAIDTDNLWHPMHNSKNDSKLYGGAGKYIFSLDEETTFDPASAGTYTWTQQALDLPANYRIKCLEELGNNLMIGTWQGTAVSDIRVADIFTWDRSSVSFGQPICIDDFGVHAMKNDGNSLIVLAGISGTVRSCNGASAYVIGQIPTTICDLRGSQYLEFYPGSLIQYKNRTFFGIGNSALGVGGIGVWSLLQTGKGNILTLEHEISNYGVTGNDGTTQISKVSALLPISKNSLMVGWRDNLTYGMDLTADTFSTTYDGYYISPLYTVGSNKQNYKFKEMEFQLVKPLSANEGVKLEYRKNLSESFITIGTYDFDTFGAILSKNIITELPSDIKVCEKVEFKISLTGTTTSPELETVIIK